MTANGIAEAIGINVFSAFLGGFLAFAWQWARRKQRKGREAEFLGVKPTKSCSIIVNTSPRGRKYASKSGTRVMTHNDALAVVQIYQMLGSVGGSVDLYEPEGAPPSSQVEFCLGGPRSNSRTAFLLQQHTNVAMGDTQRAPQAINPVKWPQDIIEKGRLPLICERDELEYGILARVVRPSKAEGVLFIVAGQTSVVNMAAVDYLKRNLNHLRRRFGDRSFCLIIKLENSHGKYYKDGEELKEVSMPT
jgi:hypothetical protein